MQPTAVLSTPTPLTRPTRTRDPLQSDTVADLDLIRLWTQCNNISNAFMAGDSHQLGYHAPIGIAHVQVAVAQAGILHAYKALARFEFVWAGCEWVSGADFVGLADGGDECGAMGGRDYECLNGSRHGGLVDRDDDDDFRRLSQSEVIYVSRVYLTGYLTAIL